MSHPTRVLIVEENDFHRALMTDVVECNDMKAVALPNDNWIERIEQLFEGGDSVCDIVVVDLDLPEDRGLKVAERLSDLPDEVRPRIVGLQNAAGVLPRRRDGRELDLEDLLCRPLDLGGFARSVNKQALSIRLT